MQPSNRSLRVWRRVEQRLDRVLGPTCNPLRQPGSLAFVALWLLAISGIWLYVVLETSASGAYESIARLSASPWSPGGLMRSLHRYAADAFIVFTALHLLRETVHGRWRNFRRFSWLSGCALLPLLAVSAIGGFWLNWDALGQFSAVATAEWLDALPLFAQPLSRNFLGAGAVSDRLFSLFVFVHLGASLLLVFGLWIHLQRLTRAAVFPPRALFVSTIALLVALCFVLPVSSAQRADLTQVPAVLSLDWILLFIHPLMYATSAGLTWMLVLGLFGALLALPLLPGGARASVAVVDSANCNGCRRCFADCPFAAITMRPHPDGHAGRELAVVDAQACAGCGICAGACPSSTPFRNTIRLTSGIDMPQLPVDLLRRSVREDLHARSGEAAGAASIIVFGCMRAANAAVLAEIDVQVHTLICAGQLPPAFIEYALRDGARGVLVASCRDGGCEFRLGARWTAQRLRGRREPHLRASIARERVLLIDADAGEEHRLHGALAHLRARLSKVKASTDEDARMNHG